jgi:hypothetical protein
MTPVRLALLSLPVLSVAAAPQRVSATRLSPDRQIEVRVRAVSRRREENRGCAE